MDIDLILSKRERLETAKENLKKHFVGMDNIIDEVISNIEVWYLMPELLTRPVVVNLWGMTGVGKTDLIRRIIRELEFENHYIEVQLDSGKNSSGWGRDTIKRHIKSNGITPDESAIVFLDEIQRFRSIDEENKMIDNDKYQDIWMLLSDGQFSDYGDQKRELEFLLLNILYDQERYGSSDDDEDETTDEVEDGGNPAPTKKKKKNKKMMFKSSLWSAQMFKQELEIDTPLEDIMKMTIHDKAEMIQEKIKSVSLNNTVRKYSKLLIFISGNLDEAYRMSSDVSETNVDADILHEFSKKINILNIKKALLRKFKPEQIARFGNTHIIYPSLSKKSFQYLIDRNLSEISQKTLEKCNISVQFDDTVRTAIYRNGVYPTQGTRPVFSTISSMVENPLPTFLFEAILRDVSTIFLKIDEAAEMLEAEIGGELIQKKIKLQIDTLTKSKSRDELALVGAHEAAHAVLYALLFRKAPAQIVSDSNDDMANGFVIPHSLRGSKENYINQVKILLAGGVAEEMIFGKEHKTDGVSNDIAHATNLIALMLRRFNMGDDVGAVATGALDFSHKYKTNLESTNPEIERILADAKTEARKLLDDNISFYKAVFNAVLEKRRVLPEEFVEIAKEYIPEIEVAPSSYVVSHSYSDDADKFLG